MKLAVLLALLLSVALPAWAAGPAIPELSVEASSPELAAHVEQIVRQGAARLSAWTGARPDSLAIQVMPTRQEFAARMHQLGGPRWAAGLALPRQKLIVLRSPRQLASPNDFRVLLLHELVHIYLWQGLKGRHAPLWLEEGLSMHLSGESGWIRAGIMMRAALSGRLLPMEQLEYRFPPGEAQASLAYAQSYYFVAWLMANYGQDSLRNMIHALSQDRPLTAALDRATGKGLSGLQASFIDDMSSRYSWMALLSAGGFLWGVVGLVAMVGLVLRRRRQRMAWQQQESPEGPMEPTRPRRAGRSRTRALQEAGLKKRISEPPDGGTTREN